MDIKKKRKRCQCGNDVIEILIDLILHGICEIKHCVSKCVPVLNVDKIKYHTQEHAFKEIGHASEHNNL